MDLTASAEGPLQAAGRMIYVFHSMFLERLHPFPDLVNGKKHSMALDSPGAGVSTAVLALMKCHS